MVFGVIKSGTRMVCFVGIGDDGGAYDGVHNGKG